MSLHNNKTALPEQLLAASDVGSVRTDLATDEPPKQPGCAACDLNESPEDKNTPLGPLSILGVAGALGLAESRRRTREKAKKAAEVPV